VVVKKRGKIEKSEGRESCGSSEEEAERKKE
jgi:hypothetical protein